MTPEIAPWDMWWTNFDPQVGREQAGLRPAIIVGTALACQLPNQLAFVVPCTTTDRQLPFHPQVTSLERPTFAMCDQLKSISRKRLVRRHPGHLQPDDIASIRFVLRQMIDTR
ncbi:MAG: type II toxin-antitoxin system PemK/MazF family toxin [Actinomycetota bacterium]|nr:type II toxin-antitoxin system PemK/MazF family toxin [Actinomycetota bacterium]